MSHNCLGAREDQGLLLECVAFIYQQWNACFGPFVKQLISQSLEI